MCHLQEKEKKMLLENKVVVVTGGSAGLGEQICYEAAKRGAIVVICARRSQLINKVKEECMALSGKPAYAFQLDIADPESVENLVASIRQKVGKVDILVNNAGFGVFQEFTEMPTETIRSMFEVNVLGMMVLTQQIALEMVDQGSGHIINVASMAGKIATPKTAVYSATKFAVLGFSNALRLELKPLGIHVTTVNPGPIETAFFDQADPSGSYLASLGTFVLDPAKLAKTIVKAMIRPRREINRPQVMGIAAKFYTLFPNVGDYLAGSLFNKK
jgi:short-subunit dehydrogenase